MLTKVLAAGAVVCVTVAVASVALTTCASAMTETECSAKYKEAKAAKTLNGMTWAEFRKAQCSGVEEAKPAATTTPPPPPAAATSTAKFPSAIDPKYAKESAGRARMHTCRDQYETNKPLNGNGGLRWIQKGGGYYSECNKHLKS